MLGLSTNCGSRGTALLPVPSGEQQYETSAGPKLEYDDSDVLK